MTGPGKLCRICGEDCSDRARIKDSKGRYYCRKCHDEALGRKRASSPPAKPAAGSPSKPAAEDDIYRLAPEAVADLPAAHRAADEGRPTPTKQCPGCDATVPADAKVCISCGVNLGTGRSIVTRRALDEDIVHHNAERVLWWVSWGIGLGFYPVASEAFGNRKPYATWSIAAMTFVISMWFLFSLPSQMQTRKNLMHWEGNAEPTAEHLWMLYTQTDYGDMNALQRRMRDLNSSSNTPDFGWYGPNPELLMAAHKSLPPRQRAVAEPRAYQLFTHIFLHGGLLHLAGNFLFLFILGSRVNALIGNIATAILYPILGVLAGWISSLSMWGEQPLPSLGASGAIMGLAGMYLVLFPAQKMHMAGWFRWWFFFRMRIWRIHGIWVVLFFIGWDVFYLSIGAETGTGHWAHLGGFISGVVLALALLFTRLFYAGGGDIISVVLGRRAWAILGRPGEHKSLGFSWPLNEPKP